MSLPPQKDIVNQAGAAHEGRYYDACESDADEVLLHRVHAVVDQRVAVAGADVPEVDFGEAAFLLQDDHAVELAVLGRIEIRH